MKPPSARIGCIASILPLLLIAVVLGLPVPSAAQSAAAEKPREYAGSDVCKACHEDRFASYQESGHGIKADPRRPAARQECETCHGPGKAHADAGGGKGVSIIGLSPKSPLPAETKNAQCLQCHAGSTGGLKLTRALWKGSVHETRGVACSNCHTLHTAAKLDQPQTCGQCHKDIKAQLLRSSHHPIREGKIQCTNCHNPHGTVTEKLISANFVNEKCYECHAEKRGPFLWEHVPSIENCLTCHTPHGSTHDKLLVQKRPFLCQTCHSNSRHPGTLYSLRPEQRGLSVYAALNNRLFNRACQNCHSQIHGSNHPSGKALLR